TLLWGIILAGIFLMVGSGIVEQYKLSSQIPNDIDSIIARRAAKLDGKTYMPTPQGYVSDLLEVYLFLFAVIHLSFQLKRAKAKSESYEALSSDIKDRLELWKLQRQKRRLKRQKEIEQLKQEIKSCQ